MLIYVCVTLLIDYQPIPLARDQLFLLTHWLRAACRGQYMDSAIFLKTLLFDNNNICPQTGIEPTLHWCSICRNSSYWAISTYKQLCARSPVCVSSEKKINSKEWKQHKQGFEPTLSLSWLHHVISWSCWAILPDKHQCVRPPVSFVLRKILHQESNQHLITQVFI